MANKICECGHSPKKHNVAFPCACRVRDCMCAQYQWDGDLGGVAVTRSQKQETRQDGNDG